MMKNLLFSIFIIFSATIGYADDFFIDSFKGMQTTESKLMIPINKSPDMDNCDISEDGLSIMRRKGQSKLFSITYPTYTINSFGDVKNNTYDRLIVGYDRYIESVDAAWTHTIIHSTATAGYVWDFAKSIDGNTYATNGVDNVFYTDGVSRTSIPSAPKGTSIEFFNNTCFISNVSGNRARVYYSVYGDATDWTTGTGATDGDSVDVADYGQKVVDMKVLGDSLLILCSNSIMKMIGTQNPYVVVEVDKSIGCKSKGSVNVHLGWVYFEGSDGQYYKTNGSLVEDISSDEFYDDFNDTAISQREANFTTITTESDFDAGISSHTSTSISPGDVVLSTGTTVYTTQTDWSAFTRTDTMNITSSSGNVITSTYTFIVDEFNDGDYTSNPTWNIATGSPANFSVIGNKLVVTPTVSGTVYQISTPLPSILDGVFGFDIEFKVTFSHAVDSLFYLDAYRNATSTSAFYFNKKHDSENNTSMETIGASGSQTSGDLPYTYVDNIEYTIWMRQNDSEMKLQINGVDFITKTFTSGLHGFPANGDILQISVESSNGETVTIDSIYIKNIRKSSGSIISPVIDTNLNNPVWGKIDSTTTIITSSNTITYFARSSSDPSMSDNPAWVQQTTTSPITGIPSKRYVQIQSSWTLKNLLVDTELNDLSLSWSTTGYYISPPFTIADINSWGLLEVSDTLDDGVITYMAFSTNTLVSSSDLQDASVVAWTPQSKDTIITVTTNTYVYIKSSFTITAGTQTPTIHSISVNWVAGSDAAEDMTSYWDKDRLYIGVMKSTNSSTNDTVFVYDPDLSAWWKYSTGVYPSVLYKWNSKFLIASSTGGVVSEFLSGDTDLGDNISAYYNTKYIAADGLNIVSSYDYLSIIYDKQSSGNLLVDYYLNGAITAENTYTLTQTGGNAIHTENFKFPLATNAYFINFKIYNQNGSDFNCYGLLGKTTALPFRIQTQ